MTRVNVIVEGPTEESFVKNVLAPFLWPGTVYLVPIILGVPGHKGGNVSYSRVRKDILLQLKQDRGACCSTMFDLYGLGPGFPEIRSTHQPTGLARAESIEQAILRDIAAEVPDLRPDIRFLPYLQVHEYEGLLFSDPDAFATDSEGMIFPDGLRIFATLFRHRKTSTTIPIQLLQSASWASIRPTRKFSKEQRQREWLG